ncbi:hypothetical protein [Burkholderia vietnamiensis]|uniref:hypothetical protein n=1 Tax=Burkholderia vietnamiensis TaxID=60552 RepID=UPI001B8E8DB0|nr:hypothetical protein [Burkholderia vietnamiensis]MBR8216264.1 hypothetical protein [Burkholderia vietnamiensis]
MTEKSPVTEKSRTGTTSPKIRKYPITWLNNVGHSPGHFEPYSLRQIWQEICTHTKAVPNVHDKAVKAKQNLFIPVEFRNPDGSSPKSRQRKLFYCARMGVTDIDLNGKALYDALNSQEANGESILFGWTYLGYTSPNFGLESYPEHERYRIRLLFPFNRTIRNADEFERVMKGIAENLEEEFGCVVDVTSFEVTQPYTYGIFNPDSPANPCNWKHNGKLIDVDALLAATSEYKPTDRKSKAFKLPIRPHCAHDDLNELVEALKYIDLPGSSHEIHLTRHKFLRCIWQNLSTDGESVARAWYQGNDFEKEWRSVQGEQRQRFDISYIFAVARKSGYSPENKPTLTTKRALDDYISRMEQRELEQAIDGFEVKHNPRFETAIKDIVSPNSVPSKMDHRLAKYFGTGDDIYDFAFLRLAMRTKIHLSELRSLAISSSRIKEEFSRWFEKQKQNALSTLRMPADQIEIIPENRFDPERKIQAIVSPYGTQKTRKVIPSAVDWAHENGYGSLLINDRMFAVKSIRDTVNSIGEHTGKPWYIELYAQVKERKNSGSFDHLACCVNSIAHPAFEGFMKRPLVVVIDEFAQVLSALQYGEFSKGASVAAVTLTLRNVLRNAVRIILMDANATPLHLDLLRMLIGSDVKIPTFSTKSNPLNLYVEYGFNAGSNKIYRDRVTEEIIECYEAGEKCIVPVEGKSLAYELDRLIKSQTNAQIIIITGDKSEEKNSLFKSKNANEFFSDYDVVIHTSAISSAVSIELPDFKTVCGFYGGYALTPTSISQMNARARSATRLLLSLDVQGKRQPDTITHIYHENDDPEGVELHEEISKRLRKFREQEMEHCQQAVLWHLEERGATIEPMIIDNTSYLDELKDERNMQRKKIADEIIGARPVSEYEYERHEKNNQHLTHAEIERHKICRVFKIKANEPVAKEHLSLYRRDRQLVRGFMARACFLFDSDENPIKGRLSNDSEPIWRVLRPILALRKALREVGAANSETQLQQAIRSGKWSEIDAQALGKAVRKCARELRKRRFQKGPVGLLTFAVSC